MDAAKAGTPVTLTALVALLVCLIPTTIGALLSAIGIAGMSRMLQANVIATSGRAVEAAGDVDVLLLDKTGTITLGNRQAPRSCRRRACRSSELADAAQLASLADETPEGRSIVVLAKQRFNLRERDIQALGAHLRAVLGADAHERRRPGRSSAQQASAATPRRRARRSARAPPTPSASTSRPWAAPSPQQVATRGRRRRAPRQHAAGGRRRQPSVLGVIELKDIVKGGIKERFAELRRMGIKTVMITGDNRLTAAAIAAEAGVDDFLAEATPEAKLALIRQYQAEGRLVAMTGDGTNDAPALAQADVAVAMNTRHAGGQGGRQHGRPRLQPDQADRGRRDRQADADDARLADHLQHRQRHRQVLRHHPGGVRRRPIRS